MYKKWNLDAYPVLWFLIYTLSLTFKIALLLKESIIKRKTFSFSLKAIQLYKKLLDKKEYIISKQFLKSATSIGANVNEALAGISYKDFIAKMSIASKEARETLYWVQLLEEGQFINADLKEMKSDIMEIIKILTSIVKTSQKKIKNKC